MTNTCFSMYNFKPFQFKVLKQNLDPFDMPLSRIGHTLLCNDANLISYVGIFPIAAAGRLWQYYFDLGEWKIITPQSIPPKVGSVLGKLFGNVIIIFISCSNNNHCGDCSYRLCLGDLADLYETGQIKFKDIELSSAIQVPNHKLEQCFMINGTDIFVIHGTRSKEYKMGVLQLDVITRKWEVLYPACPEKKEGDFEEFMCPREVIFYNDRIYVFANGEVDGIAYYCQFSKIHMFDLTTRLWYLLNTKADPNLRTRGLFKNLSFYSCVQCSINRNLVYVCGGHYSMRVTNVIWRLDLNNLQWEKLTNFILPKPVYMHSTIVTPSGRMYCYGGRVIKKRDSCYSIDPNNTMTCAWITIPKLKILSWEAMVHYFKEQMFESSTETLKKIGIPPEFYNRIIEARRHVNNV